MRVIVTGGLGALGRHVMTALADAGHDAVSASRRSGVDLESGVGLAAVLEGADAVVQTADTTNPRKFASVTVGATQRVLDACASLPRPPHVVTISIVGCERVPYAYYRAKRRADEAVLGSGLPATVVRATQFHSLAAFFARVGRIGPIAVGVRGMRIQPVDVSWVGRRLAEIATGESPRTPVAGPDLTGPDALDLATITRLVAEHEGRRAPRPVLLPPIGTMLRALGPEGAVLGGPDAEVGGEPFQSWLDRQPPRLKGR